MGVGTSLGQYYQDNFDYQASSMQSTMPPTPSEKPAGEFKSDPGTQVAQSTLQIDRDHHVPLVASAIMHPETGQMVGMAIDHRVPENKEYEPFLALHEGTELPWMQDYIKDGMSPQDAYHKAHDFATARESAAVRAYAVDKGKDPDKFQDEYKQFYRDAASVAAEPSDKDRHPDAHTTKYRLDEAELQKEFKVAGEVVPLPIYPGTDISNRLRIHELKQKILQMNPNSSGEAINKAFDDYFGGGATIHKLPGVD